MEAVYVVDDGHSGSKWAGLSIQFGSGTWSARYMDYNSSGEGGREKAAEWVVMEPVSDLPSSVMCSSK